MYLGTDATHICRENHVLRSRKSKGGLEGKSLSRALFDLNCILIYSEKYKGKYKATDENFYIMGLGVPHDMHVGL